MNLLRKKENMAFVNEMRLFHGTNPEVVEAICKQNFDWRVNGRTGLFTDKEAILL